MDYINCERCKMPLSSVAEYHPLVACILFDYFKDSQKVCDNLKAIVDYGMRAQESGIDIWDALANIDAVPVSSDGELFPEVKKAAEFRKRQLKMPKHEKKYLIFTWYEPQKYWKQWTGNNYDCTSMEMAKTVAEQILENTRGHEYYAIFTIELSGKTA